MAERVAIGAVPVVRKVAKIAMFLDIDNTNASIDNATELYTHLQGQGEIAFAKFYGYADDKVDEFEEFIVEHRIETIGRMRMKQVGVSVIDTRLVAEALAVTGQQEFDSVFVWTGVGDMIPLFSQLKNRGLRVLTIDNAEFDCNNKFVDQKIRMFSPHRSVRAGAGGGQTMDLGIAPTGEIPRVAPPMAPQLFAADLVEEGTYDKPVAKTESDESKSRSPLDGFLANVPQLPRRKGAPEFGASEFTVSAASALMDKDNPEIDDDEFIFNLADALFTEIKDEMEDPNYFADMGDLNIVDEDIGRRATVVSDRRALDEKDHLLNMSDEQRARELERGSLEEAAAREFDTGSSRQSGPMTKVHRKLSDDDFSGFGDLGDLPDIGIVPIGEIPKVGDAEPAPAPPVPKPSALSDDLFGDFGDLGVVSSPPTEDSGRVIQTPQADILAPTQLPEPVPIAEPPSPPAVPVRKPVPPPPPIARPAPVAPKPPPAPPVRKPVPPPPPLPPRPKPPMTKMDIKKPVAPPPPLPPRAITGGAAAPGRAVAGRTLINPVKPKETPSASFAYSAGGYDPMEEPHKAAPTLTEQYVENLSDYAKPTKFGE